MSEIQATPEACESVARVLVDAINAAVANGHPIVASAETGVICISMHARERWIRRPGSAGVSPVGAAILYRQPEPPEVEVASCVALGVSAAWLMGFEAGIGGEPPHAMWAEHVASRLIAEGYVMGREIRTFVLTETCEVHSVRHRRGRLCPKCAEDVTS